MPREKLSRGKEKSIKLCIEDISELEYTNEVLYRAARRVYERLFHKKCQKVKK